MHLDSSSLINLFGGSIPALCSAWCRSHLACDQACTRPFCASDPGQRDKELVSWVQQRRVYNHRRGRRQRCGLFGLFEYIKYIMPRELL